MNLCRNCEQWETTTQWKGKCKLHPWEKDRYSEDASVPDCLDYVDKLAKYYPQQIKEALK